MYGVAARVLRLCIMPELQPPLRLHDLTVDDPSVTRVLNRRADPARAAAVLGRSAEIATSVTVVVPSGTTPRDFEGLERWSAPGVRAEVLVMGVAHDALGLLRDRYAGVRCTWRRVDCRAGDRAEALTVASVSAEHEFTVVSTGGGAPYEHVPSALCHMWADGCDAAILEREPLATEGLDPAGRLAQALGLGGSVVPGRLVVLRRWVARWLFNEVTRAIDPGAEVADRARLLGIGIAHVTVDPAAAQRSADIRT